MPLYTRISAIPINSDLYCYEEVCTEEAGEEAEAEEEE